MKSVTAVFAGFISMTLLVVITTAVAATLMLGGASKPTAPYLVVNVAYSLLFAAVGGYVTSRLAPRGALRHVVILACVVGVLAVTTALTSPAQSGQPVWYGWVIGAVGVGGILAGGFMRQRASAA